MFFSAHPEVLAPIFLASYQKFLRTISSIDAKKILLNVSKEKCFVAQNAKK